MSLTFPGMDSTYPVIPGLFGGREQLALRASMFDFTLAQYNALLQVCAAVQQAIARITREPIIWLKDNRGRPPFWSFTTPSTLGKAVFEMPFSTYSFQDSGVLGTGQWLYTRHRFVMRSDSQDVVTNLARNRNNLATVCSCQNRYEGPQESLIHRTVRVLASENFKSALLTFISGLDNVSSDW